MTILVVILSALGIGMLYYMTMDTSKTPAKHRKPQKKIGNPSSPTVKIMKVSAEFSARSSCHTWTCHCQLSDNTEWRVVWLGKQTSWGRVTWNGPDRTLSINTKTGVSLFSLGKDLRQRIMSACESEQQLVVNREREAEQRFAADKSTELFLAAKSSQLYHSIHDLISQNWKDTFISLEDLRQYHRTSMTHDRITATSWDSKGNVTNFSEWECEGFELLELHDSPLKHVAKIVNKVNARAHELGTKSVHFRVLVEGQVAIIHPYYKVA